MISEVVEPLVAWIRPACLLPLQLQVNPQNGVTWVQFIKSPGGPVVHQLVYRLDRASKVQ